MESTQGMATGGAIGPAPVGSIAPHAVRDSAATHTLYHSRPFNLRYAIWHRTARYPSELTRTHRTARANWLYIMRQHGVDDLGPTPDWSRRDDLVAAGRCAPARGMDLALSGVALWDQADRHARLFRPDEPTCAHAVGSLPMGDAVKGWRNLIEGFCEDHLTSQGMIVDWAIHHRAGTDTAPAIMPHVHLLITSRVFDRTHPEIGRLRQTWLRSDRVRKSLAERWWTHTGMTPPAYASAA